ncbi:MAG: hypothetical protein PHI71_02820 [Acidiphilium sp.]|nr:hypothetical protein [Acidiphilium sp.]
MGQSVRVYEVLVFINGSAPNRRSSISLHFLDHRRRHPDYEHPNIPVAGMRNIREVVRNTAVVVVVMVRNTVEEEVVVVVVVAAGHNKPAEAVDNRAEVARIRTRRLARDHRHHHPHAQDS